MTTDLVQKRCCRGKRCVHPDGPLLPVEEFYHNRRAPDGYAYQCKRCHRESRLRSDAKPQVSARAKARRQYYYLSRREEMNAQSKARYWKQQDELNRLRQRVAELEQHE